MKCFEREKTTSLRATNFEKWIEKRNKQFWVNRNLNENPKEVIQIKLEEKKKEQEVLKLLVENKLESQAHLLENLLEKQENFYLVIFEDVSWTDRTFLRTQDRLQEVKDKLSPQLSSEEIEELCKYKLKYLSWKLN